jgi:RimJ/RimL family protein N-acetyltransferase
MPSMSVIVVPRTKLNEEQLQHITSRIYAPEHELDAGPRPIWQMENYVPKFHVAVIEESDLPIGTIYVGGPPNLTDVAWWIDSLYRHLGYGSQMVDALAPILKAAGVTGIGPILITAYGDNHTASAKLVKRLRGHFASA